MGEVMDEGKMKGWTSRCTEMFGVIDGRNVQRDGQSDR